MNIVHPIIPPEVIENFRSYLIQVDDCLEWIGGTSNEYGYFYHHVEGLSVLAHRFAFVLYNGYIDNDLLVCHTCDNPPCCKKEHLFQGTHQDNSDDKFTKGRAPDRHGELNPCAKLSNADVSEIRRLRVEFGLSYRDLALLFSVSHVTIRDICIRRKWK